MAHLLRSLDALPEPIAAVPVRNVHVLQATMLFKPMLFLTLLGVFPCIHTQACMPGQAHTEEESTLPSCSSRLSQLQQCVFAGDKQHGATGGQSRPSNFVRTS